MNEKKKADMESQHKEAASQAIPSSDSKDPGETQFRDGRELIQKSNPFLVELASIVYYSRIPGNGNFEDLPEEEVAELIKEASLFMVALDKMNKMVVTKVEEALTIASQVKNLDRLQAIIDGFNKRLKTTKPELYPSRELAHVILEGKMPNEKTSSQG